MRRSESLIKTDRLLLRQIDETDDDIIVNTRSVKDIYRYFKNPVRLTKEEHHKWYEDVYMLDENNISWIAVDDETGNFVGIYGARKIDDKTVEISYITSDKTQRRGYGKEAVEAILNWCERIWNTLEYIAVIHVDNTSSLGFAKSLGFTQDDGLNTGRDSCFVYLKK